MQRGKTLVGKTKTSANLNISFDFSHPIFWKNLKHSSNPEPPIFLLLLSNNLLRYPGATFVISPRSAKTIHQIFKRLMK